MRLLYGCPWWGLDHLGLESMLEQIASWGYDAVETGIPEKISERNLLRKALADTNLSLIAHQYRAAGERPDEYIESLKREMDIAASLNPLLINSHTGRDYWIFSDNARVVECCLKLEEQMGITIAHETHRGRFLYSAAASLPYFMEYPEIKINADLSHWVCVSESLLENHGEAVSEAISRSEHIHARVGHEQGPQISDLESQEWTTQIESHLAWWESILRARAADGRELFTLVPEFGPSPYMGRSPLNGKPFAEHTVMNLLMKKILKEKFSVEIVL